LLVKRHETSRHRIHGRPAAIGLGKLIKQGGSTGVIADLSRRYEEADRATILIRYGMQLGVHATFRASNQAARAPFFTRRLEAVRWALR